MALGILSWDKHLKTIQAIEQSFTEIVGKIIVINYHNSIFDVMKIMWINGKTYLSF